MKIAAESEATAEEIAEQHGVSRATVERAGQFAAAVDKLGLGAEVATGQVEASRKEIMQGDKLPAWKLQKASVFRQG